MADERQSSGWTRFFRKKDLAGEDFFGKVISGVARIFEGGDEEETYRQIRAEVKQIFQCDDISLFAYDPDDAAGGGEGDWVLTVKSGFGEGNRVSQNDGRMLPDLQPGRPVAHSELVAQQAALKAIALAFEENAFYGCDIEQSKVLLLKDPRPEDDMGSGDLSVLAIPLNYNSKVGRVVEETRVGVLALFKTPVRRELGELEKGMRSLLAHALVTQSCVLRDPITRLYTETHLREELGRYTNMLELTGGQLGGGLIVGMVDCLKLYRQTLEATGKVDPGDVGHKISEALRGVAQCVWRRARDHRLGPEEDFRCGIAGRVGHHGFGVLMPLMKSTELATWCAKVSQEVIQQHFVAEELLAAGDVTVSLRAIPFSGTGVHDPLEVWKLARKAIDELETEQVKARRDPAALSSLVKSIRLWDRERGQWVLPSEYREPPAPG
jgi:GGDEF domain-containing protein